MKKVYKYKLIITDEQTVLLPKGAKPLCVKLQYGYPYLWALVNPNEEYVESRDVRCAATGHHIEDGYETYLGTVMSEDNLVLHFFIR